MIDYSLSELRTDWKSGIPSRMKTVAELAVDAEANNKVLQDLIVSSARSGDQLPASVNTALLRIAFNDMWEVNLDAEDRRLAVALALASLLGEKIPNDFAPLDQRHPGVVLALTATAGENSSKVLAKIPGMLLTRLPPPYGPGFTRLMEAEPDLNCGDTAVLLLARFATQGIDRAQDLRAFLREHRSSRLQALALIYSHDNQLAKLVLDLMLNHPNFALDIPETNWARSWNLTQWQELEPADQLLLLAGVPPRSLSRTEDIVKLLMHPAAKLRVFAVTQVLERVSLKHPGAVALLTRLQEEPDLLTPEQLFRLLGILEQPAKVKLSRVKVWLESSPPQSIVAELLLASAKEQAGTKVDTLFANYLRERRWRGAEAELAALSQHPDPLSRLFSYDQIYRNLSEKRAEDLLGQALTYETEPRFKVQLKSMLQQLNAQ